MINQIYISTDIQNGILFLINTKILSHSWNKFNIQPYHMKYPLIFIHLHVDAAPTCMLINLINFLHAMSFHI